MNRVIFFLCFPLEKIFPYLKPIPYVNLYYNHKDYLSGFLYKNNKYLGKEFPSGYTDWAKLEIKCLHLISLLNKISKKKYISYEILSFLGMSSHEYKPFTFLHNLLDQATQ